jgi:predicted dehydrogenase
MPAALVIGYGRQGKRHARVLGGMGFDVDTVDPVAEGATFTDMGEAHDKDYDAVAVAVPIRSLSRIAIDAMFDFGSPVMVVEKPLGETAEQVAQLDKAAKSTGTLVIAGYTERYNPAVMQFEAMLADGDRPGVVHVAARRYSPDGGAPDVDPIIDLGVHDIDLAIRLAPGAVTHVDAGQAPHRSRTFVTLHEDGSATVIDLANRMVDNEAIDGAEPLVSLWDFALGHPHGYVSLEHEVDVMRCAEYLIGHAEDVPAA